MVAITYYAVRTGVWGGVAMTNGSVVDVSGWASSRISKALKQGVLIGSAGGGGGGGSGWTIKGEYDSGEDYVLGDVVRTATATWVANDDSIGVDPAAGAGAIQVGMNAASSVNQFGAATATPFAVSAPVTVSHVAIKSFGGTALGGSAAVGIASNFAAGFSVPWLGQGVSGVSAGEVWQTIALGVSVDLVPATVYRLVSRETATSVNDTALVPNGLVVVAPGSPIPNLYYDSSLGSPISAWNALFKLFGPAAFPWDLLAGEA